MPRAGEWAQGLIGGAAGGASIGSFAGPWGTAIGGGIGALAGGIGTAIGGDDDDERRKEAARIFAQQQALERDAQRWSEAMNYGKELGGVYDSFAGNSAIRSPIKPSDAYMLEGKHALFNRGQQLDRDRFRAGMRKPEGNAWQEWVSPLLGLGAAVSSGFKQDPNAARKAQLNKTSDEASWIDSLDLNPQQRAIALAENDERTKSALFGPRTRMSAYDF